MKIFKHILAGAMLIIGTAGCNKVIDVEPKSNEGTEDFYRNYNEVNTALTGAYNGLQNPLNEEWRLTELRSDNVRLEVINSSSSINVLLLHLDTYELNSTHSDVYEYWLSVYKNIRSINYVLRSLGVSYVNNQLEFNEPIAQITLEQRDQLAAEALFLRAYHYFNLVRLYGSVFLITEPVDPGIAKQVERAPVSDLYQLIIEDLKAAESRLPLVRYNANASDLGRATVWAAKGLLAKVYLTLNRKGEALPLLDNIISDSGHGLEENYADVFSTGNEMNREIIFAVRFKAGGLGLGNFMANHFAPLNSGNAVVNGDGRGYNYPTQELDFAYTTPISGFADQREGINIGRYNTALYTKKFTSQVLLEDDAENDFPVLRFSDVLLMKAEALGFDGPAGVSVSIINQIRQRAGAGIITTNNFNAAFYQYPTDANHQDAITNEEDFLDALFNERRLELAFENQRFFDLQRTGKPVEIIRNHFEAEFDDHYRRYTLTLEQLKANVTPQRMLLPIPQREIDTNEEVNIGQNDGY